MLRIVAKWHPFLWLGAFTVLVMTVGPFVPLAYDDNGIGTAWFRFTYALTWVFRQTARLATRGLNSLAGVPHAILAIVLGAAIYLLADLLLSAAARRFAGDEGASACKG